MTRDDAATSCASLSAVENYPLEAASQRVPETENEGGTPEDNRGTPHDNGLFASLMLHGTAPPEAKTVEQPKCLFLLSS